ncbi:hypothetical protein KIN20_026173 [Parelaphostrongylus tenuis]|uniref:Uncharacterized protein n=1 Tax=Parelaphostrongylus tenuis TaxID=148309 RepID=A0AAD5NCF2_PARTN|nr:hypothetical protein KIN20_026173 [Parelaphostrongylus tenuis]
MIGEGLSHNSHVRETSQKAAAHLNDQESQSPFLTPKCRKLEKFAGEPDVTPLSAYIEADRLNTIIEYFRSLLVRERGPISSISDEDALERSDAPLNSLLDHGKPHLKKERLTNDRWIDGSVAPGGGGVET